MASADEHLGRSELVAGDRRCHLGHLAFRGKVMQPQCPRWQSVPSWSHFSRHFGPIVINLSLILHVFVLFEIYLKTSRAYHYHAAKIRRFNYYLMLVDVFCMYMASLGLNFFITWFYKKKSHRSLILPFFYLPPNRRKKHMQLNTASIWTIKHFRYLTQLSLCADKA